jgi:hypothetical protein
MSRLRLMVLCLLAGLAGCMEGTKAEPLQREPLANRLGDKVDPIIADFISLVKKDPGLDPELKRQFESQNTEKLKEQLDYLLFGRSKARDRTPPEPLKLTAKDFAALAPDLNKALKKHEVSDEDRKELLDLLAPSRCGTLE